MSVRKLHTEFNTFYYFTFTCFRWISLFDITNFYDYVYKCFDILKSKRIYTCGYVIMPNHLHSLVFTKNDEDTINNIIGETKRFMAHETVKRLKRIERKDLLKIMHDSVDPNEAKKNKIHNVFQPSADIKEILTEKFFPPLLVFQKVCLRTLTRSSALTANFLVTNNKALRFITVEY